MRNAARHPWTGRIAGLAEKAAGVVRLLAWAAMVGGYGLMLWALSGSAHADDPKDAARQVGNAGAAAAGAIARDAAKAQTVPGFAGTNVPERSLTDAGMESAARGRLANPDDPGGSAGRAVIDGAAIRPAVPVPANDPAVARGRTVQANPLAASHRTDGLASGGSADCGAGVTDAGRGGACGSASYCVGAACETIEAEGNTSFARSAAMLNMVLEMGGDEFDRNDLRFFAGERRTCEIKYAGLANCCRDSGLLVGLANCSAEEKELAEERHAGNTHYLGRRCAKRVLGVCVRRERAWCLFGSKLGRILHQQARPQLGIGWGNCRGFTVAEIERIDFDRLNLSEFTENLEDSAREPAVVLPDKGGTQTDMADRVRRLRGQSP